MYADREIFSARETDDVDILVEIFTRGAYARIEEKLRQKGFSPDSESGVICRYLIQGLVVDIMPVEPEILGFGNSWYKEGYKHSILYQIDSKRTARILSAPYLIATKFEAFLSRGLGDGRTSHDFEDIIFVLNNRSSVWAELDAAPESVREYLQEQIGAVLKRPYFHEWISANLERSEQSRTDFIVKGLKRFASGK